MSMSEDIKDAGLKSAKHMSEMCETCTNTLRTMYKKKPKKFRIMLAGCVSEYCRAEIYRTDITVTNLSGFQSLQLQVEANSPRDAMDKFNKGRGKLVSDKLAALDSNHRVTLNSIYLFEDD